MNIIQINIFYIIIGVIYHFMLIYLEVLNGSNEGGASFLAPLYQS